MTEKKKSKPNPIENAIGKRAKPTKDIPKIVDNPNFQTLAQIQDEPSPQELLTLEELNRQTVERLQDPYSEEETPMTEIPMTNVSGKTVNVPQAAYPSQKTLVSKPDRLPVTKNSSEEYPPQKIEDNHKEHSIAIEELAKELNINLIEQIAPAEDIELVALRKFIMSTGFVLSTVAYHIVSLCSQPMVIPLTTTWDFRDRANVPDMVFALLKQPGYIEGIWPALKVVMGTNIGNETRTAGIATTMAFFDTVKMLPVLKEMRILEVEKKS